jgi:hypothetical protein
MFRNAAAIVAGVVIAFGLMVLIERATSLIYPLPPNLHYSDTDSARPYLATLPAGEYLLIFASSVVAAFVGTLTACYIGTAQRSLFGGVAGGVVLAYTIANFIAIPYPYWLSVATLLGVAGSTLLAMRISPPSTDPDNRESDTG